ncbi:membrane hypothetical protein [Candidatus Zixiibacteriota bacterium]|nr:membrane hypothetical protein [candidate division Zixibacteria bacterium]
MRKVLRYGVAIIVTVLMLMIARRLSPVHSEKIRETIEGVTVEHTTVGKTVDGKPDIISLRITNPDSTFLFVTMRWAMAEGRLSLPGTYGNLDLLPADSGLYRAPLPIFPKGKKVLYYFYIHSRDGKISFNFPNNGTKPILIKYEGSVPLYIVIPHIFLMFVGIFLATLALFDAFNVVWDKDSLPQMARNFKWATVAVLLGGYPFGWAMNYFAFGTIWEGIPFGWDFTDNKTQIVLLYLIFLNLSMLGTLYKGRFGSNNYSDKTLGYLALVGYLLVMAIYLIPHSIQFSVAATAVFAYGLTAIIIALYILGLSRKQKWTEKN